MRGAVSMATYGHLPLVFDIYLLVLTQLFNVREENKYQVSLSTLDRGRIVQG